MSKSSFKKKICCLSIFLIFGVFIIGCNQKPAGTQTPKKTKPVLLASTIGPIDSGIIAALENAYETKTGVRVRHVGAGTG